MEKVKKQEQLTVVTQNTVGTLAEVNGQRPPVLAYLPFLCLTRLPARQVAAQSRGALPSAYGGHSQAQGRH